MNRSIKALFLACAALFIGFGGAWLLPEQGAEGLPNASVSAGEAGGVKPDVPYEPTPDNVVEKMLEMAQVGPGDLVYDLGCGDGRIVIAAARKGARGVGIDIDPERIRESRANAEAAGVSHRVRFLQQDLFESDIGEADAVMLFLWPSVNYKLRPKLLRELRPGVRIVSHEHDMREWTPDRTVAVGRHEVHLWQIPANASGSWKWTGKDGKSNRLDLQQAFQKLSGTLTTGSERSAVKNARIAGDCLEIAAGAKGDGRPAPVRYEGCIDGHVLKGHWSVNGKTGAWTARRDPATVERIDGAHSKLTTTTPE